LFGNPAPQNLKTNRTKENKPNNTTKQTKQANKQIRNRNQDPVPLRPQPKKRYKKKTPDAVEKKAIKANNKQTQLLFFCFMLFYFVLFIK
jgi:phage terminase small subunit